MLSSALNAAESLKVARLQGEQATLSEFSPDRLLRSSPLPADLRTPLGSLWKLYVHAYALDRQLADPPYQCLGQDREEVYCCERGESITRDQALVRSCGLYYQPARLGIGADAWREYWQQRRAPDWLADLPGLQPERTVPVAELLRSLAELPAQAELRRLLLDVLLQARDSAVLGHLGGMLRVKTWSWHLPDSPEARIGGFAGWLVDGSPIWASGGGTSQPLLAKYAPVLARELAPATVADPRQCVEVALFDRYPLAAIEQDGQPSALGRLSGQYWLTFANGNRLQIASAGELVLGRSADGLVLTARLELEDYVARVIDREASAQPAAAARALAVVIRSYLLHNADAQGQCLAIADSSATQRVAPRPPSAAARAVAAATADLVLSGAPVGYHLELAGANRLSWSVAVAQAQQGARFDQILSGALLGRHLSRWDRPQLGCQTLEAAQSWLRAQLTPWRPRLDRVPGYSETRQFEVCQLHSGRPFIDRANARIYARGLFSLQDRLDLTHEYLHLALAAHPLGQDEAFVEALTRQLILE